MFVWMIAILGAVPSIAGASGLAYRSASTGQWVGIFQAGDTRVGGSFNGATFKLPPAGVKAQVASVPAACGGPNSVAAFLAEFAVAGPKTGIFLYDAASDTIIDAVIEGSATPIGFGNTYGPLKDSNPAVAIDPTTCTLHVIFRAKNIPNPAAFDTTIFDALFTLPGYAPAGALLVAQEGTAPAPPPFPAGATFGDFPSSLRIAADYDPSFGPGGVVAAFRVQMIGGGLVPGNKTGVVIWEAPPVGPFFLTAAHEGDPGCAPTWIGAGATYDVFPPAMEMAVSGNHFFTGFGPNVFFRGKSLGGAPTSDTALVDVYPISGCGASTFSVAEGGASPALGTYGNFSLSTPLATTAMGPFGLVAYLAKEIGPAPKVLYTPFGFVRQGFPDTTLGSGNVTIPPGLSVAVTPMLTTSAFNLSVNGWTSGLFTNSGPGNQLLTWKGTNVQIDDAGNMTARFP
jgi:hypothetical protein